LKSTTFRGEGRGGGEEDKLERRKKYLNN